MARIFIFACFKPSGNFANIVLQLKSERSYSLVDVASHADNKHARIKIRWEDQSHHNSTLLCSLKDQHSPNTYLGQTFSNHIANHRFLNKPQLLGCS